MNPARSLQIERPRDLNPSTPGFVGRWTTVRRRRRARCYHARADAATFGGSSPQSTDQTAQGPGPGTVNEIRPGWTVHERYRSCVAARSGSGRFMHAASVAPARAQADAAPCRVACTKILGSLRRPYVAAWHTPPLARRRTRAPALCLNDAMAARRLVPWSPVSRAAPRPRVNSETTGLECVVRRRGRLPN
jgi:hypothetical protein